LFVPLSLISTITMRPRKSERVAFCVEEGISRSHGLGGHYIDVSLPQ
jgi:hypothetical protein